MNREIVWTTQFKKDDKLAMKRHMDMDCLLYTSDAADE